MALDYTPLIGEECPANINELLALLAQNLNVPGATVRYQIGDIILMAGDPASDSAVASATFPTRRPWAVADGNTYSGYATPAAGVEGQGPGGTHYKMWIGYN